MIEDEFRTVRGYQIMEQKENKLTSSMEDYLEMIYRYSLEDGYIRINILAEQLHVKAASASKMVQKLGELGLLNYKKYEIIILSDSGKQLGKYLLERHNIIENFLRIINCEDNILQQTELMEHNINSRTVEKINILNNFFLANNNIADSFIEYLNSFYKKKN